MLVIPAVDIKNGKAVRLIQGKADRETVYDEDPVNAARRWVEAGAQRVHIVDLDGAFEGHPRNAGITLEILMALPEVEFEIGGGLRTAEAVAAFMNADAARCVIGTMAVEDREFLTQLTETYPGRISLGLDAKDGMVVTKGWVDVSETRAVDLLGELADLKLAEVIYTDIDRDGMLGGPNFKRLEEVQKASPFPLIASGGVTTIDNLKRLKQMDVYGCIVGKALYDGRMKIEVALALQ
ncbi:MAG: 1-(5-phosphoribosyl)-5-[(5-phosphoribosylamino)methylideneamino]imidazole-4-carboxamide isomerase [Planctomycetes bacterium]|nr:1-(5-phosphoribosyl)-5-[(5-phosphoribosylamino)methylideneamino]imidazole-4-carboxamide isomerase [Planctomycetota bacterium]